MRFLLGMGISPETGLFLKKLGHDSLHVMDECMDGASDFQIMENALKEGRIILPHDFDF